MNGNASQVFTYTLAFAGMDASTYFKSEGSYPFKNSDGAAYRAGGTVKRRKEVVTGSVDFPTAEPLQLAAG